MDKTQHQLEMERQARRAADAAIDTAQAAREQTQLAQRQLELAEAEARFQRNVMKLEVADLTEKIAFYQLYNPKTYWEESESTEDGFIRQALGASSNQAVAEELSSMKEAVAKLGNAMNQCALAKAGMEKSNNIFWGVVVGGVFLAYMLYGEVSSLIGGYSVAWGWIVAGLFGTVGSYLHGKKWLAEGKPSAEKRIAELSSAIDQFKLELDRKIERFNENFSELGRSGKFAETVYPIWDDRKLYMLLFNHIRTQERDFPATCRLNLDESELSTLIQGLVDANLSERGNDWDAQSWSVALKRYICLDICQFCSQIPDSQVCDEYRSKLLPSVKYSTYRIG